MDTPDGPLRNRAAHLSIESSEDLPRSAKKIKRRALTATEPREQNKGTQGKQPTKGATLLAPCPAPNLRDQLGIVL